MSKVLTTEESSVLEMGFGQMADLAMETLG